MLIETEMEVNTQYQYGFHAAVPAKKKEKKA